MCMSVLSACKYLYHMDHTGALSGHVRESGPLKQELWLV